MNNQSLTEETSIRYLGVNIDSNISWKSHMNYIAKKTKSQKKFRYSLQASLFPKHKNVAKPVFYLSRAIFKLLYNFLG